MSVAILQTSLPFPLARRGKVRDVYDLGEHFLFVATDRISAFDVVLSPGIPDKGRVLTQISNFWFQRFDDVENHIVESKFARFPAAVRAHDDLRGRSVVVKKCEVVPIECVARGYLVGSGLKEYKETGQVCGITLEKGLTTASRLSKPIFTPATKEETGHDQNISFEKMSEMIGGDLAGRLRDLTLQIYSRATELALTRGIIIADTKFEFGHDAAGKVILIDEVLTPDSSRFWPAESYAPGRGQPSFDKQPLRDYLDGERKTGRWNGEAPPPPLPPAVVHATSTRYLDAFRRITGSDLNITEVG